MTLTPKSITLNDGQLMPQLGLGVWQVPDDIATDAVRKALEVGYRSIDTAVIYKNETGVGQGMIDSRVDRGEIFLTTKIWNTEQGTDSVVKALESSLTRLKTPYVDLLLIHWPVPSQNRYLDTWKTMITLKEKGLTRSIGVSNFHQPHLKRLIDETGVTPAVNQIELHPYLQQTALRQVHQELGIHTESWSPLAQAQTLKDPVILALAEKHGKTAAQVVIRWHLDSGLIVIPKSQTPSRIESNFEVLDFSLDEEDMKAILALNEDRRIGPDPDTFS